MINDEQKLGALVAQLGNTPWISLDTEADSLHAYPEKVCLIQISTPAGDELVDPLAKLDLGPLFKAVGKHELIMHGADYDLRLLRKHHDFVPRAIFDTMLASRLLGATQFGLTHLVLECLGVTLEKGSQKADWARRPLTERMEAYARNDTHYLKPLAERLRTDLEAKGRLTWHQESCARLIADCAQVIEPDPNLVWRVKGSHTLGRAALAVLRELWHWRENEAIAANRPPFFILHHETLSRLALAAAEGHPLEPLLPRRFSDRRRDGVVRAIQQGLAVPPQKQPEPLRHTFRRLTEAEKRRAHDLQRRRDARAAELGIDPTLIASRATLLDLAQDWNAHQAGLMEWQRKLLSESKAAKT